MFWWAIKASTAGNLSAIFSPDAPARLVEEGPYRFIRHPLYCSYILTWTAGLIATAQPWLLVTVLVMAVIYLRAAIQEEQKFFHSPLATAYRSYRTRTGLIIPNPWKLVRLR